MPITPDSTIYWHHGFVRFNATILYTWLLMLFLTMLSWFVTRHLKGADSPRSRWQNALEAVVVTVRSQIRDICPEESDTYLPFAGTIFLFIATSSLLEVVPGWHAPTASLSTTAALAICVAIAVHIFGVLKQGVSGYLRHYIRPAVFMLPFNLLNEISRTLALALRLFGNIMSESLIVGVLLAIAPFVFPLIMQAFGLLTGFIQAYIFAVLSMVYIAAAVQSQTEQKGKTNE